MRINNYYELKGNFLGGGVCQLKNLNDFIHIGNLIESDLVNDDRLAVLSQIHKGHHKYSPDEEYQWSLSLKLNQEN